MPLEAPLRASGQVLVPPRRFNPAISARTESVIVRAMAVEASRRFQHAAEMRAALGWGEGGAKVTGHAPLESLRADWRMLNQRQRLTLSLLTALVVMTVMVVCGVVGWNLVELGTGDQGVAVVVTPSGVPTETPFVQEGGPVSERSTSTPLPSLTPTPTRTPRGAQLRTPTLTSVASTPTGEGAPADGRATSTPRPPATPTPTRTPRGAQPRTPTVPVTPEITPATATPTATPGSVEPPPGDPTTPEPTTSVPENPTLSGP
ncbi:MAG: hypothetical protein BWY63_03402 [Chloroflexi bacterium ADurb.Bin360]|nr:MAG: hypothetical protein BWY63_03402 [Chloroflexi bacterium ADurb.Bin360]